jgi:hypothetical protein
MSTPNKTILFIVQPTTYFGLHVGMFFVNSAFASGFVTGPPALAGSTVTQITQSE